MVRDICVAQLSHQKTADRHCFLWAQLYFGSVVDDFEICHEFSDQLVFKVVLIELIPIVVLDIRQNNKEQEPCNDWRKYDQKSVCIGVEADFVVKKNKETAEEEVVEEFHSLNVTLSAWLSSLPLTKIREQANLCK